MFTMKILCHHHGSFCLKYFLNLSCLKKNRHNLHLHRQATLHSISKKDLSSPMQSHPVVEEIEGSWYEWWESKSFFRKIDAKEKFVMLLPPPNITGKLHMGHALTVAIQDALVRWNQMCGRHVIWVPGCDHAGIATQVVVEKHLWETQQLTKHDLGRKKFLEEVHNWKEEKGTEIYQQIRSLGASLDWNRDFFTMDQTRTFAVNQAFIKLFEKGLIYRSKYMSNWCCALNSVISDSEVNHKEIDGPTFISVPGYECPVLFGRTYDIAYKLSDSDETVVVSTTRPETLLGDTALMVHPEDPRYTHLHGKTVVHPFRRDHIPIIASSSVDKDKGTGVVKITPGHSITDFEISKEHNLPILEILDDDGRMVGHPDFQGIPRYEARDIVLSRITNMSLFRGSRSHSMSVPMCSRSGDIIEPRIKMQWFLNIHSMSKSAIAAVKEKRLNLHPSNNAKIWENFLSGDKDWCISRQLWWGHQIPVYWASRHKDSTFGNTEEASKSTGTFVAAISEEKACDAAANILGVTPSEILFVQRDSDVLDTWFSSSLLPFSSFGWPNDLAEYQSFYPTTLLETGHDILYFWVARMVMLGEELTGKLPFKDVLLHGLLFDSEGNKMSKSKGNALDPMDIIKGRKESTGKTGNKDPSRSAHGVDALRFSLCSQDIKQSLITLDLRRVEQDFLFRNKIWQSVRFLIHNMNAIPNGDQCMKLVNKNSNLSLFDRWIMSRLATLVEESNRGFQNYDLHIAVNAFKTFWYTDFCDVFLETVKLRLWNFENNPEDAQLSLSVLWTCCSTGLKILSPFMPFISEELYQRLPAVEPKKESIMQCDFPASENWDYWKDGETEYVIQTALKASLALRKLKNTYNVTKKASGASLFCANPNLVVALNEIQPELTRISYLSDIYITSGNIDDISTIEGNVREVVSDDVVAFLQLKGNIDIQQEMDRLAKRIAEMMKEVINQERILTRTKKEEDILAREKMLKILQEKLDKTVNIRDTIEQFL